MKVQNPKVVSVLYKPLRFAAAFGIAWLASGLMLPAQPLTLANHSFESQVVNPIFYVDSRIDHWQKTPQPGWFVPTAQLTWDQTVGMFIGTPPFSANPYSNLVGNQAAYLLSLPGAGIFQDNASVDWNGTVGGLNAIFETGHAYQFTLGVFGKQLVEGYSALQLSLYYRDGANLVTVGTPTTITFSASTFNPGGPFTLVDYTVTTPLVQAGDAWAGRNIGIKIESLAGDGNGYWDLDNARLVAAVPEPTAASLVLLCAAGCWLANARRRRAA